MKLLRNKWFLSLAGLAALVIASGLVVLYLMSFSIRQPPAPDFPTPRDQTESNLQDLDYLKTAMHKMDRSFSREAWESFDSQIDALIERADMLDAASLEMGISRAVAAADNGHTNVIGASWGLTLNSLPLRFYWFEEDLHVLEAHPDHADLLGARVRSIGDRTPNEIARVLDMYIGGRENFARELSIHYMHTPQALHAIGLLQSEQEVPLVLETPDGRETRRSVAATASPVNGSPPLKYYRPIWPRRALSPAPGASDDRPWVHVLDGREIPFTLQQPDNLYWSTHLDDGQILYMQLNGTMSDPDREGLDVFLQRSLDRLAAGETRFVILDFRSNPGGSYTFTADFVSSLPEHLPEDGKIFLLTSANTWSAAFVTSARLKHFAGPRLEIVGEPAGDRMQFWAEAATRIILPNSGLAIGYATGYHDWESGCSLRQIFICFPLNYVMGVAAGDLEPTMPVSWPFVDYLEGRDVVFERVMQRIAEGE